MGLSSSQANLMSLTSRLSDLELKAQRILNNKIRLSDMGEAASKEYSSALNKEVLKIYSGSSADGSSVYQEATMGNLTTFEGRVQETDKQRFVKDGAGNILVSNNVSDAYSNSNGNLEMFLNNLGYSQISNEDRFSSLKNSSTSNLSADVNNTLSTITSRDVITYHYEDNSYDVSELNPGIKSNLDSISTPLGESKNNLAALVKTQSDYTADINAANQAIQKLDQYGAEYVKGYQAAGVWQYQDGYQAPDLTNVMANAAAPIFSKAQNLASTSIQSTTTQVSPVENYTQNISTKSAGVYNFMNNPAYQAMPAGALKTPLIDGFLVPILSDLNSTISLTTNEADKAKLNEQKGVIERAIVSVESTYNTASSSYVFDNLKTCLAYFSPPSIVAATQNIPKVDVTTYSTSLSASDMIAKLTEVGASFDGLKTDFGGSSLDSYITGRKGSLNYAAAISQQGLSSGLLYNIKSTLGGITQAEITDALKASTYTGSLKGAPIIRSSQSGDPLACNSGFESGVDTDGKDIKTTYENYLSSYRAAVANLGNNKSAYDSAQSTLTANSSSSINNLSSILDSLYNNANLNSTQKDAVEAQRSLAFSAKNSFAAGDYGSAINSLNLINIGPLYTVLQNLRHVPLFTQVEDHNTVYSSTLSATQMSGNLSKISGDISSILGFFASDTLQQNLSGVPGSIASLISGLGGSDVVSSPSALNIKDTLSLIPVDQIGSWIDASSLTKTFINDPSAVSYYSNLFNEIKESKGSVPLSNDIMESSDWLTGQIEAGNIFLYEYNKTGGSNGTGDLVNISWTTGDTFLHMTSDKEDMARAEADYETKMAQIQAKDKKFDVELTEINTEHKAIETEVDTVKKVIDKNIDRTFKMFNA